MTAPERPPAALSAAMPRTEAEYDFGPVTAPEPSPGQPPAYVDARCSRCTEAGKGAYRMVGRCRNCGLTPVLGLHSVSHEATLSDCPVCGTRNVSWDRLATPDEIPVEFGAAL